MKTSIIFRRKKRKKKSQKNLRSLPEIDREALEKTNHLKNGPNPHLTKKLEIWRMTYGKLIRNLLVVALLTVCVVMFVSLLPIMVIVIPIIMIYHLIIYSCAGQSKQPVVLKTPSGVIISPSVGASVNRPTFNLNSQQQRQGLLKSPSSPTETQQALPNANVGTPDLKNITSFNVHLLQNQSVSTNADESSSKVIVDL